MAALCLGVFAGCLVPQTDHILRDLPEENLPPRIVEVAVTPPSRILNVNNGGGCPDLQFSAPVADPDLGDLLYVRWFSSDTTATDPVLIPNSEQQIANPTGEELRKQPASLDIHFDDPTNPLAATGTHVIEVLVADGTLVGRNPQPRDVPPDGGAGILTYATTYAWVVNVSTTDCQP